jgi:DNA polymerase elongation subunit (family B)
VTAVGRQPATKHLVRSWYGLYYCYTRHPWCCH